MSSAPKAFLDRVGDPSSLPELERDPKTGRFKGEKGKKTVIAKVAREILEQEEHVEKLKEQARNGVGSAPDQLPPSTHKVLVEYGYGQPRKNSDEEDEQQLKMRALREAARELLKNNPEQARVIDISMQRSATALKLPEKKEDGDPAA